jgi:nitrite reductase/ring-hydroxylating ferredoxin subunit
VSEEEHFERAIQAILDDRSPRHEVAALSDEHRRMLRIVQLRCGSRGQGAGQDFIDQLHDRLFPVPIRVSRRRAILSSLGTLAAGIVAGVGIERAVQPGISWTAPPIVGPRGHWFAVATLVDLPDGAIRPFSAGAIHGFLIHQDGRLDALSRICTHMGCMLDVNREERTFECPCHGAEFDLHGNLRYGPRKYGLPLPPLPRIQTRVRGHSVEVFTV